MAAVRNQSSYTEINSSNSRRSLPTRARQPGITAPRKAPREVVVEQHTTPPGYKLIKTPTKQLDQPSKDCCSGYDQSWPGSTSEQRLLTRTGLNRTGEGEPDQEGHYYVDESYDKLLDREGTHGLSLWEYWRTTFLEDNHKRRERISFNDDLISNESEDNVLVPALGCEFPMLESVFSWLRTLKITYEVGEQYVIHQLSDYQDSELDPEWKHRGWWNDSVRLVYDEAANNGDFPRRPYNRIDTLFLPKKMPFGGPCGSTSSAELGASDLPSHSFSREIIAPNEIDLYGRDRMSWWKDGPGRNKDWRSCRYLKAMSKGKWAKYRLSSLGCRSPFSYLIASKETKHYPAITHFSPHAAIPKDMLRQKPTSRQGHSSCLNPKFSWQAMKKVGLTKKTIFSPKSRARCEPWMTKPIDMLDIEEARMPKLRFSANSEVSSATIDDLLPAMVSTHTETSSPHFETLHTKSISLNDQLSYESFGDAILGACLRLKRLLRTETHYEVYDAESLSNGNQKYEVRAYNLRGLSLKVRNYKIRNLKRASARSSCIGSLEQGGKKWLVFADPRADLVPEPSGDCSPLWSTRDEYDRAFPVLEPRRLSNCEKSEKEAFQDGVVVESYEVSFAKALEDELSKILDAKQALEVIDRLRERVVASLQSCLPDDKIAPISDNQKKPKSPEQAKRLRDRQRLSRQKKRMAKTALSLSANSDGMSQTLDMTSEPPTETFSGNENNQVALDRAIAILQEQQDLIKRMLGSRREELRSGGEVLRSMREDLRSRGELLRSMREFGVTFIPQPFSIFWNRS